MKRILIVGLNSYIGKSFGTFLAHWPEDYLVNSITFRNNTPTLEQFQGIDVVFCVIGLAHSNETSKNRRLYYSINRDLVTKTAEIAKMAGVRQFILISSMAVYGMDEGYITKQTKPNPISAYGGSKYEADEAIRKLENDHFLFSCLRPPMVYGSNCKGNYQALRKIALTTPVFPAYDNQRSMLYIDNLCEFVKQCIDCEKSGIFFPQNADYVSTSDMVERIASAHNKTIIMTSALNWVPKMVPAKILRKAFGNLMYEQVDTVNFIDYDMSIRLTEKMNDDS